MKILIVNGYVENQEGLKSFLAFRYLIQKIFLEQTIIIDMETEFIIRSITDLEDFLYESTSSNIKTSSGSNFDNLDIIFITGEPNTKPWSKHNRNVQILIRMCLRAKKFLFTSSFAMETLVFQAATNFDRSINIINGDEGGKITEMPMYSTQIGALSCQDYFLDNSTGDLYTFRNDQQEWSTRTNIGLHSQLAAQTYSTIGKFIIKAPIYRPKNNNEGPNLVNSAYVSKNTEIICYIKKQYILHWAFQDMPSTSFIAQKRSKWDVHPFSFTNSDTTFVSLAESDSGPLIICFGDYIMGCQFEIIPKYFESLIPLKNFIYNKLLMISENKQSLISILNINASVSSAAVMREMMLKMEATSQRSLNFAKLSEKRNTGVAKGLGMDVAHSHYKTFRNSGYAASKKNIGIIVSENAVCNRIIKVEQQHRKGQSLHELGGQTTSRQPTQQGQGTAADSTKGLLKYKQNSLQSSQQLLKVKSYNNSLPSFEDLLQSRLQELGLNDENAEDQDEEEEPITQRQVRRFLHPMLSKECLKDETGWVPGSLMQRERKPAIRVKQDGIYRSAFHKILKSQSPMRSQSVNPSARKSGAGTSTKFSSIFAGDPYKSSAEVTREFEKKEAEKIIGPSKLDFSIKTYRNFHNPNVSQIQQRIEGNNMVHNRQILSLDRQSKNNFKEHLDNQNGKQLQQ